MITIVDYGVGNLASIQNMIRKAGGEARVSSTQNEIEAAEKLVLPGIGAFDTCVEKLRKSGLLESLNRRVLTDKIPVLGICVGLQLLVESSEEGVLPGLGWIGGKNIRFDQSKMPAGLKIPHMGWTEVILAKPSRLFEGMYPDPRFYFVHSYYPVPANSGDSLLLADHGIRFTAALEKENILGVQFHPEKSHKFGQRLFENFIRFY